VTDTVAVVVTECVTVGTTSVVVTRTVVGGTVRVVVTTAVVVRSGTESVGVVRVTSVCVAPARRVVPHEVRTTARTTPSEPADANERAEATRRELGRPRSIMPRVYARSRLPDPRSGSSQEPLIEQRFH